MKITPKENYSPKQGRPGSLSSIELEYLRTAQAPKAFDSHKLFEVHNWVVEEEDKFIPQNGFLSDYTLALRGMESPSLFCLWAGLMLVSSVIQRQAWIPWGVGKLWLNMYLIFVGPPAIARKSTTTGLVSDVLAAMPDYYMTERTAALKQQSLIEGMTSPEKFHFDLRLKPRTVTMHDQTTKEVHPGSGGILILSELTSAIKKNKGYVEGMMEKLLHFYDCKDRGNQARTIKHNVIELPNLFFNMTAATTPEHIAHELPETAIGGGFLSRTLYCYKADTPRMWPIPEQLTGTPTVNELCKRLAWIAEVAQGPFTIDNNAIEWYAEWYARFKQKLKLSDERDLYIHARMDNYVLKIAALFRAQDYNYGRNIRLEDLQRAAKLLEYSYQTTFQLMEAVVDNPLYKTQAKILSILQASARKQMSRTSLLQQLNRSAKIDEINESIATLHAQKYIHVYLGEKKQPVPTGTSEEQYRAVGVAADRRLSELVSAADYQSVLKTPVPPEAVARAKAALQSHLITEIDEEIYYAPIEDVLDENDPQEQIDPAPNPPSEPE